MVYKGKNSFYIDCNCGCDSGMVVKVINDLVYISFTDGKFYAEQTGLSKVLYHIESLYKNINAKHKNKRYFLSEIIVKDTDIEDFLDCLDDIEVEAGGPKGENQSFVAINTKFINDGLFEICLLNNCSYKDILTLKTYRGYEVCMNKRQWTNFVYKCHERLDKHCF